MRPDFNQLVLAPDSSPLSIVSQVLYSLPITFAILPIAWVESSRGVEVSSQTFSVTSLVVMIAKVPVAVYKLDNAVNHVVLSEDTLPSFSCFEQDESKSFLLAFNKLPNVEHFDAFVVSADFHSISMQLSLFLLTHLKIFNEGQRFAYALVCVGFEQIWGSDDIMITPLLTYRFKVWMTIKIRPSRTILTLNSNKSLSLSLFLIF